MRWRGGENAALSLLRRAVALVEEPDVHLEVAFAMSHDAARDAEPLLEAAARRADTRADAAGAALARGLAAQMRIWTGEGSEEDAERLGRSALGLLEETEDHAGLAEMWFALANGVYNSLCRYEQVVQAAELARRHQALAGRPHQRTDSVCGMGLLFGPRPVAEVLHRLDSLDAFVGLDLIRATLLAMCDRLDEARSLAREAEEYARELGHPAHPDIAEIESIAGDHEIAAERFGLECDWLSERGLAAGAVTYSALQGRELCLLGRFDEAERRVTQYGEHPDAYAPLDRSLRRRVAAFVAAHRGAHAEAERLARVALRHVSGTDSPKFQADAFSDLADVLETAGRRDEAIGAWQEALDRYERKGIVPLARHVRERMAALEPA